MSDLPTKKEVDDYKHTALTDTDIQRFCSQHKLFYHLKNLNGDLATKPAFSFIFTGDTANEFNKGNTNHWMFLFGPNQQKQLFDSYGQASAYQLPDNVAIIKLSPHRLQEYSPSSVCGQYCCIFYKFLDSSIKDGSFNSENIGREFCHHFGFTDNHLENDKKILAAFQSAPKDDQAPLVLKPVVSANQQDPSSKTVQLPEKEAGPQEKEEPTHSSPPIGIEGPSD